MSVKVTENVEREYFEGTSIPLKFDCITDDKPPQPIPISSAKVYIFVTDVKDESGMPIYINGRDGTNLTNLTINGNTVTFDLMPADNVLVLTDPNRYHETHSILFEVFYNSDTDVMKVEFAIRVKKDPRS